MDSSPFSFLLPTWRRYLVTSAGDSKQVPNCQSLGIILYMPKGGRKKGAGKWQEAAHRRVQSSNLDKNSPKPDSHGTVVSEFLAQCAATARRCSWLSGRELNMKQKITVPTYIENTQLAHPFALRTNTVQAIALLQKITKKLKRACLG